MVAYQQRANIHLNAGQLDSAMVSLRKGMDVARSVKNLPFELTLKASMGRLRFDQGNTSLAITLLEEVLIGSREIRNVELQKSTARDLVKFYRKAGRLDKALEMFELQVMLTDSLEREQNQREMIRQEYKYGYEKEALADSLAFAAETAIQQKEVQKQKLMRNGFMGGFALVALFAGVFFVQRNRISKARKRSDELLLNILPEEVAEELKDTGSAQAKHFNNATILFTDFKGFTQLSEMVTPAELVDELNTCFKVFDGIMEKYRIEKIKTIGDAYMAAGGLPDPHHGSTSNVVRAAIEMQHFMKRHKVDRESAGKPAFEMRVGIHTGPVVAGIVGVKKFQYDIWGDTVNTASRMESAGEVGKVNISQLTYEQLKDDDDFTFESRGKIVVKGKGDMDMWFIELA
jgi:class 3 adenylate cyclase